ncbi:hypothetical protein COBT_003218, partial [Conglomerata obtusa]
MKLSNCANAINEAYIISNYDSTSNENSGIFFELAYHYCMRNILIKKHESIFKDKNDNHEFSRLRRKENVVQVNVYIANFLKKLLNLDYTDEIIKMLLPLSEIDQNENLDKNNNHANNLNQPICDKLNEFLYEKYNEAIRLNIKKIKKSNSILNIMVIYNLSKSSDFINYHKLQNYEHMEIINIYVNDSAKKTFMFPKNENKSTHKNIIIGLMLLPELVKVDDDLFYLNKLTAFNTKIMEITEVYEQYRDTDNKNFLYKIIINNN